MDIVSPGGDRGLFMSRDGGETWTKTLGGGPWTGVSDVVLDPRDPEVLYAATWQHHRTVAAYMGGGPETGIHRSTDGGTSWTELETGLPEGDMGKIGLAISMENPDVIYAAIELERRSGVWRSEDRGASWVVPTRWEAAQDRITTKRFTRVLINLIVSIWWVRRFRNLRMEAKRSRPWSIRISTATCMPSFSIQPTPTTS